MPRRPHVLRMSRQALLPVLALAAALLPAPASASQCREVPFAQLIREADVIFTGRALTWDAALATTFAVERVYKGSVAAHVIVESGAVKYAALAPPDRYLVLAVVNAPGTQPGNLYVHTCGGSRRLLAADAIPHELGEGTALLPLPAPPVASPPADPEPPPPATASPPPATASPPPATASPPPATASPPPPPERLVDPPGLTKDSYYLLVAPGLLAFDIRYPAFRLYTWGISGGRLFTGAGHFAAAAGAFFEHNLWINRVDPERGDRAKSLSYVRFGPEMRIGGSSPRIFGYALLRLGLDMLGYQGVSDFSLLATGGLGIQGALLNNRRLLLGTEPMVDYSYPLDYAFFRVRVFIGARF
ncbi:hypothetical protein [Nannocystis sp.]|uniref:hypothetical protein n=1 Tax=Nannocystis sp. TaxID=1962667 RepID=UPI0025E5D3CD|nr:hypothetical protein [Nannocystis sp.]MBK7826992.1 hypothetical protein [Nannocystis sp.]